MKSTVQTVLQRWRRQSVRSMGELLLEKEVIFAEDIERILGPKVKPAEDDRFDAILKEAIETGKKIEPDFSVEV